MLLGTLPPVAREFSLEPLKRKWGVDVAKMNDLLPSRNGKNGLFCKDGKVVPINHQLPQVTVKRYQELTLVAPRMQRPCSARQIETTECCGGVGTYIRIRNGFDLRSRFRSAKQFQVVALAFAFYRFDFTRFSINHQSKTRSCYVH